jgi:hypothetical protein
VRERIRRPDFGHLEIQVTVDDAKTYTLAPRPRAESLIGALLDRQRFDTMVDWVGSQFESR